MIAALDLNVYGPLVAVLAAIGAFLKIIFKNNDQRDVRHDAEMARQRHEFTTFLGNHMSKNTQAQEEVASALRSLADEIRWGSRT